MKFLREPSITLFWDNNVWMCLFCLGNEPYCAREVERRKDLESFFPSIEIGAAGVVFSPCLLADVAQDVVLDQFVLQLRQLEDAGYITIAGPTADWEALARLREQMRRDVKSNPDAFRHVEVNKRKVGLGDTAAVFAAIRTNCSELWTYDPMLLAFSGRSSVRGLKIVEPHTLLGQGVLITEV